MLINEVRKLIYKYYQRKLWNTRDEFKLFYFKGLEIPKNCVHIYHRLYLLFKHLLRNTVTDNSQDKFVEFNIYDDATFNTNSLELSNINYEFLNTDVAEKFELYLIDMIKLFFQYIGK